MFFSSTKKFQSSCEKITSLIMSDVRVEVFYVVIVGIFGKYMQHSIELKTRQY